MVHQASRLHAPVKLCPCIRGRDPRIVAAITQWTEKLGWNRLRTANLLHLCPRTLRQWDHDFGQFTPELPAVHFQPLGRPTLRSSPQQRNSVIALLDEFGPALGVPGLRLAFPDMARAELEDILLRYRRVWRKLH